MNFLEKFLRFSFISIFFCFAANSRAQTLIHYWSFNSLAAAYHNPNIPPIAADLSVIDTSKAKVVYTLIPGTSSTYAGFWDNNTGDTTNARNGFPAGNSLRFRNPSDSSELRIYSPSTNYKNLIFKWAVQTSSAASGQKIEVFDYSIDSGITWKTSGLSIPSADVSTFVTSFGLITVSISDTLAFNNPKFIFRIKFSVNTSGSSGNNRFENMTVEGTFIPPVSNVPLSLIHYWNFNSLAAAYHNPNIPSITPDFSTIDTGRVKLVYTLFPGTSGSYAGFIDNNAGDLTNVRNGAAAGQSLRFRNPSDSAELRLYIPTATYKNIVIKYALQSSSAASGQKTQLFDYSINGGVTWKTSGLSITSLDVTQSIFQGTNWGLVIINLANDTLANNNYDLVFRIRFSGNTTGANGNNRFDNITVEGTYIAPDPTTITFASPKQGDILIVGKHALLNFTTSGPVGETKAIEYTTDHGLTWTFIGSTTATSFDWIVPNTPSINTFIRITDAKLHWAATGPFVIYYPGPGVIKVSKPAHGDTAVIGSTVTIAFSVSGVVSETRFIDYSVDSGKTWTNVGAVSNSTSIDWTVPNTATTKGLIRISDTVKVVGISSVFTIAAPRSNLKTELIHYWNFDNIVPDTVSPKKPHITDLTADYSALDKSKARVTYFLLPGTSLTSSLRFIDPVAPGADTNKKSVVAPGAINNGLRLRNPLDSMELRCSLPTTGHSNIVIKYALESSSTASGDSTEIFDYSVDGGTTWKKGKANGMKVNGSNADTLDTTPLVFQGTSWGLVTIDLSADKTVENNPNFIFRIRFKGNTSLAKGNNRIDNFTVEGDAPSGGQNAVVHYWNFDNVVADTVTPSHPAIADLTADYSALDKSKARVTYFLLPGTSLTSSLRFIDPVAPGADSNKRSVVAPGIVNNALRLRNPLDSMELRCFIPTTGFTNIVIKYALESSSIASGDSTEIFDYSVDGGTTWKKGKANGMKVNGSNVDTLDTTPIVFQGTSWGLVTIDLSVDKTVEDNPNFVFRIRFKGNTSLAKGNNRIDNLTVEGFGSGSSGPAPIITVLTPVSHDTLIPGHHKNISFFAQGAISSKRTIEFSADSGKSWSQVAVVTEGTTSDWIVPNILTGKGFIRVRDTANIIGKSGLFAIVQPGTVTTVTVGSTPGKVREGDSVNISWTTLGYLGGTVDIDMSLDSQKTWTSIKTGFAYKSKTSFGWSVPMTTHYGAVVRVKFASGAAGISSPFDIIPGTADVEVNNLINGNIEIWPNPFSQTATIRYELNENSSVSIIIRDLLGREIFQLADDEEFAGKHEVRFNGWQLQEGTYLYILTAGRTVKQGKFVIMR